MIALQIHDVKMFMASLLMNQTFDRFLVNDVEITTFTTFKMQGILNKDWYSTDEMEAMNDKNYVKWELLRPIAYSIIKGSKTPDHFKIVLQVNAHDNRQMLAAIGKSPEDNDAATFFLNIIFEENSLRVISGTSIKMFTMDKSQEIQWDQAVKQFLTKQKIAFEEI
ncbi:hypothetical protein lbkm_0195 [Lachnospiraceae bacterium KM106-2]|nr:hypothetical protein lbkm_0195 [Lachnospiraceae bacterium KM106-2]